MYTLSAPMISDATPAGLACGCGLSSQAGGYGLADWNGPIIETVVGDWYGWWMAYVGDYSWWNTSINNIRVAFNEVMRGPEHDPTDMITWKTANAYNEWRSHVGYPNVECSDLLYRYYGDGCTSFGEVEYAIQTYHNLVLKGSIPEFAMGLPASTLEQLYRKVAAGSGVDYGRVKVMLLIMHALYNSTPSSVNVAVIYPLAVKRYGDANETPEDVDTIMSWVKRGLNEVGGAVTDTLDVLKWVLLIGGVGALVYIGWQLLVAKETVS